MMNADFERLLELCRSGAAGAQCDSRKVQPGDVFVAMPGVKADGSAFIAEALARGAAHVVCSEEADAGGAAAIRVKDPREALWRLAQARWRTDVLPLRVIGVTGTNGKTTCAWLLEHLFSALGQKTGVLGTVDYHWPGHRQAAPLTTPGAPELHEMLFRMGEAGVGTGIMEASSHALAQGRARGIPFAGAIFTNLTQDHLDYHKEMECYFREKARLFLELPEKAKAMAINGDDRYGRRLLELAPDALSFGLKKAMPRQDHLWGQILAISPDGMRLMMARGAQRWELSTQLVGAFNASNLLAVQALGLKLGLEPRDFKALEGFAGVPGRLERIANGRGLHIFVDYAHTPDALANALRALRGAGFQRIVTVFGCGGDRDRAKRPLMGKAVAENSDVAILTSDNPRTEDPEAIMRDVEPGLRKARKALRDPDRRSATALGIKMLRPGDALLIAGKGHEDYQIIGDERRHYSDQETARELLNCA